MLVITYQEPALLILPAPVNEGSPQTRRISMHFLTPSLLGGGWEVQHALFDRISNTARKVILGPICDAESMIVLDGLNQ